MVTRTWIFGIIHDGGADVHRSGRGSAVDLGVTVHRDAATAHVQTARVELSCSSPMIAQIVGELRKSRDSARRRRIWSVESRLSFGSASSERQRADGSSGLR
ncbi:hypothetical protein M2280_002318 [Prescottella agglutinans]|uniref:Uncharacterized protein n=1 Tax=Prescottella agglutinans TaxID=1644129 RepID=A0ABT6M9W4_9NOCA|nr:hypothetical protein [Prescottella agglutinans]